MSVLYRKYRSKKLADLVGQDHIVSSLQAAIEKGTPAHAYLLTGPRGTGKTSVARIIAHEINGITYDENNQQLDIIEIDAASNRRIDEIRDLREKINIAPTTLKYKVYIIDEVHMLTREAFNALLKTLEEPPEHAIFILATTEIQKVPDTIISRTQRYSFKPISITDIIKHLSWICQQEKIEFDEDGLRAIAEHANGGFRDAISLLDQVRHNAKIISREEVQENLGVPSGKTIEELWELLQLKDSGAIHKLQYLFDAGFHAPLIAKALLKRATEANNIVLARKLLEVGVLNDPKTELLLLLLETAGHPESKTPNIENPKTEIKPEKEVTKMSIQKITTPEIKSEDIKTNSQTTKSTDNLWPQVLDKLKSSGNSIYGPLRLAETSIKNDVLVINLNFPFHVKRVSEPKNMQAIEAVVKEITAKEIRVVVQKSEHSQTIDKDLPPIAESKTIADKPSSDTNISADPDIELMSDPLSIVKNVFGGAEVL